MAISGYQRLTNIRMSKLSREQPSQVTTTAVDVALELPHPAREIAFAKLAIQLSQKRARHLIEGNFQIANSVSSN